MSRRSKSAGPVAVGGWNVAEAAIRSGAARGIIVSERHADRVGELSPGSIPVKTVSRQSLDDQFGDQAYQGIVTRIQVPDAVEPGGLAEACAPGRPLVALEELQDPQNVGSAFRAAAALGAAGVILTRHRTAPISAATIRASAGTLLQVPFAVVGGMPNWLAQVDQDLVTIGAATRGGVPPWQLDLAGPTVIVFGSEGDGLKQLTARRCAGLATVPLEAAESLNVAQAITVLLYELRRQVSDR